MRLSVVCVLPFLCVGCVGRGQDAHEPGDRLGTYHASGKLVRDTCQASVLGVQSEWQFDVKLSRTNGTLYWLNGEEAIPGTIASDGKSFVFESGVEVPLSAAQGARSGCTILRSDEGTGTLSSNTTDVPSFDVALTFGYAAKSAAACAGFVGVVGGFAGLPCSVAYELKAERTALAQSLD